MRLLRAPAACARPQFDATCTWINRRWDSHDRLMKGCREWLGGLPADVARRIAWDNAAGLFGLPSTP